MKSEKRPLRGRFFFPITGILLQIYLPSSIFTWTLLIVGVGGLLVAMPQKSNLYTNINGVGAAFFSVAFPCHAKHEVS